MLCDTSQVNCEIMPKFTQKTIRLQIFEDQKKQETKEN